MSAKPKRTIPRLAVEAALGANELVTLEGNAAHYLSHVLRLTAGDPIILFNRTHGEWRASIAEITKRSLQVKAETQLRPPVTPLGLTVCFAPIKGGRLETIIEKATELGASILQPVITQRTIVDKMNRARAYSIAREAAEQCERFDWPEIREPVKLLTLLSNWPADTPLIYGDESGASESILSALGTSHAAHTPSPLTGEEIREAAANPHFRNWAILVGPEGGFTPEEFGTLKKIKNAHGVGLGPRILRADTAVITLCVATIMAWGDWAARPRFGAKGDADAQPRP